MYTNYRQLLKHIANSTIEPKTIFDKLFGKYNVRDISETSNNIFFRVYENNKIIGAIDVTKVSDDLSKIDFVCTNDFDSYDDKNNEILDSLVSYAIKKGKDNNSKIIKIDVHGNLKRYNDRFKKYGFQLNGKKCSDNPYWVEAEMLI